MQSNWFHRFRPNPFARLRLFCLPYAGGHAAVFRNWAQWMPADIELLAAQYPGRGARLNEPPIRELEKLVDHLSHGLVEFSDRPWAIFGHSFGALIGWELARQMEMQGRRKPIHLFVSACRAPHLPMTDRPIHGLPDQEFIEQLRALNGTPFEVLEQSELLELLLPAVRADFKAFETYKHSDGPVLECPITVLGGYQDLSVQQYQLEAWKEYTGSGFEVRMFPGDHFFLHSAQALVVRVITQALNR